MPAPLRHHGHDLVDLLDRQQRPERAPVSRLAAPLPAGWERFRSRRGLGWIRGRRPGGVGRGLADLRFQVPDAGLQGLLLGVERSEPLQERDLGEGWD